MSRRAQRTPHPRSPGRHRAHQGLSEGQEQTASLRHSGLVRIHKPLRAAVHSLTLPSDRRGDAKASEGARTAASGVPVWGKLCQAPSRDHALHLIGLGDVPTWTNPISLGTLSELLCSLAAPPASLPDTECPKGKLALLYNLLLHLVEG